MTTHILNVPESVNGGADSLDQSYVNVRLLYEAADDVGKLHQFISSMEVAVLTSHLQYVVALVARG